MAITKMTPTRANLIKAKSKLAFSTKGYDLLDKKRTILIQEIVKLVDEAKEIEEKIEDTFAQAYKLLQECNVTLGVNKVQAYALSVPEEKDYQLRTRSVMGVDIPEIVYEEELKESPTTPIGAFNTNPALDMAIQKFNEVKYLSYKLAQVENTAFKLSQEIKKASKSANALSKIQIPQLQEAIHYIEDSIEEKEREENFRIKKVKAQNQKKNSDREEN